MSSFAVKKSQAPTTILKEIRYKRKAAGSPIPVAILGTEKDAKSLYDFVSSHAVSENKYLRVAAVFADGLQEWPGSTEKNVVVNDTEWAESFVECCEIRSGIIAIPAECDAGTTELVKKAAGIFRELYIAPDLTGCGISKASISVREKSRLEIEVGSSESLEKNADSSNRHSLKRMLDVAGVLALGVVSLPFLLFVALAILLTSEGPLFYKQVRISKSNRLFFALKFRTMFLDAAERLEQHLEADPVLRREWESVHKLKNDPRVTSVGKFLRRFSLDELPQLWNVLVGDMSLIGPRPIVVSEIERYGLDYAAYEAVRPGLTGLWQVSGRNDTTYEERVALDSYYVRNWSLRLDARIVLKTFRAVISGAGAY